MKNDLLYMPSFLIKKIDFNIFLSDQKNPYLYFSVTVRSDDSSVGTIRAESPIATSWGIRRKPTVGLINSVLDKTTYLLDPVAEIPLSARSDTQLWCDLTTDGSKPADNT